MSDFCWANIGFGFGLELVSLIVVNAFKILCIKHQSPVTAYSNTFQSSFFAPGNFILL
jgi:hypothetical protein